MKKILVIAMVLVLVFALAVTAFASSGATVSTSMDSKTGKVTITVKAGADTYTSVVDFEKNTTKTHSVGGYDVKVEYNGNGVKSATIVSLPVGLPNNGKEPLRPNEYDGEIRDQYNNANFHCNAFGGNGRVWTTYGKEVTQKLQDTLYFVKTDLRAPQSVASKDTTWLLDNEQLARVFVCEVCGSDQWISFSNNSGVPDGKNIQITHPGQDITIVKQWFMNNPKSFYEIEKTDKYG
ncbi:MAG: hypothetical protein FWD39_06385, partial [Clostridiales bacterium]|nr:hypothetical protein [Clostridiales bacterium]